jgi:fatty-acid peroxygenase
VDLAWKLWRAGYRALDDERRKARPAHPDAFESRLLGRRSLVVRGPEGARAFYDETLVRRKGAIPPPLAALLFGSGAVHGLDDAAHKERKAVFLDLLDEGRVEALVADVEERLCVRIGGWRGRQVTVFDELVTAYGGAVLAWAGIGLPPRRAATVSRRLAWIVDGFGFSPGAYPRAWACRWWANRWAAGLVRSVRSGELQAPSGTVLAALAAGPLPASVAGVELLNVLRPTVAVAWPGTFAAVALAEHPEDRAALETSVGRTAFAHEVRRRYPFVPALAGRVRRNAEVLGQRVREGQFLVLDVIGTHGDPSRWPAPHDFDPARFSEAGEGTEPDPYGFVPQGGGDPRTGHRCPGEPLTVRLLATTIGELARVPYGVRTARYAEDRMPTLPEGRLRIDVRA